MKGMSPVTLGVILLALPVLAWLWWTSGADEGAVTAVSRGGQPAAAPAPADPAAGNAARALPPIETFSAMVDRPLFAALRHPTVPVPEPEGEPFPTESIAEPPAEDNIRDRYRLIGTVEENGRVFALLVSSEGSYVRVRRGDRLENWTVDAVSRQRVLMVNGENVAEFLLVPDGMN
ncbi:pilus assembly protein PilP [Geminicoccus harenae]|uniref:pilus assembly protein PilP n=1 Tax=Geminicoccus harenae TaxID=2498453 RepID=UPI001C969E0B|nr:pilus assembly protein PilP [Geminicoccus harenae]